MYQCLLPSFDFFVPACLPSISSFLFLSLYLLPSSLPLLENTISQCFLQIMFMCLWYFSVVCYSVPRRVILEEGKNLEFNSWEMTISVYLLLSGWVSELGQSSHKSSEQVRKLTANICFLPAWVGLSSRGLSLSAQQNEILFLQTPFYRTVEQKWLQVY